MNWPRWLAISVLGLAIASVVLLVFVLIGLVRINDTVAGQNAARERNVCVTETTTAFWSHVARGLVELREDGTISATTAAALNADAEQLETVNDRCPA